MDESDSDGEDGEDLGEELHLSCLLPWSKTAGETEWGMKGDVLIAPGRVPFNGFR
jgi:hypothetical protein